MILRVHFTELGQDFSGVPAGELTWDGENFHASSDDAREALEEGRDKGIFAPDMKLRKAGQDIGHDQWQRVWPDDDPEAFMWALSVQYQGAYFRASKPKEIDKEDLSLDMAFDESKHPRGKPENAGEFAKKGEHADKKEGKKKKKRIGVLAKPRPAGHRRVPANPFSPKQLAPWSRKRNRPPPSSSTRIEMKSKRPRP